MTTPSKSAINKNTSSKSLHDYQLGDSLGKGAFGQVYRALNWATGETVAVKEITLANIPKSELGEIMSEIDLLKNLNHPNIVKYKGFVKTREFLYIILEFCENGSLHGILKRFGKFPENLVAVYISQVLQGLVYLHDQGVIHRDIKGANILTNKDGTVKLADFGVASSTTTGAVSNDAVVGSPYWMAPEVIEQTGATTASDIWSVGCVVIELLEGYPPYHDLDPMPALFRIVQDDCPPIPEGASPIVKDFLVHCFQKDCNLRISAKKLLRHPWMISARKQMREGEASSATAAAGGGANTSFAPEAAAASSTSPPQPSTSSSSLAVPQLHGNGNTTANFNNDPSSSRRPLSNYNYDEAVLKVQEWNQALALKSPSSRPSKHPNKDRERGRDRTYSHSGYGTYNRSGSPTTSRPGAQAQGGAGPPEMLTSLSPSNSTSPGTSTPGGPSPSTSTSVSASASASGSGSGSPGTMINIPPSFGAMAQNLRPITGVGGLGLGVSGAQTKTQANANTNTNTNTKSKANAHPLSFANVLNTGGQSAPEPEEQTDNWDDDFDLDGDGIGIGEFSRLRAPLKSTQPSSSSSSSSSLHSNADIEDKEDTDSQTIKPGKSPRPFRDNLSLPGSGSGSFSGSGFSKGLGLSRPPSGPINTIVEDYSADLVFDGAAKGKQGEGEDEDDGDGFGDVDVDGVLEGKVKDFKMKNSLKRGLFHPDDIKIFGLGSLNTSPGPKTAPLPDLYLDPSSSSSPSGSGSSSPFLSSSPRTGFLSGAGSGLGLGLASGLNSGPRSRSSSRSPANTASRRTMSGSISSFPFNSNLNSGGGSGGSRGTHSRPPLSPIVTASASKARSKSSSGFGGVSPILGPSSASASATSATSLRSHGRSSSFVGGPGMRGSPEPSSASRSRSQGQGPGQGQGMPSTAGSLGREGARRVHSAGASMGMGEFATDERDNNYYDKYVEYMEGEDDEDYEDVFLDADEGGTGSGAGTMVSRGSSGSSTGGRGMGTVGSSGSGSGSGSGGLVLLGSRGGQGRGLGVEELKLNTRLSNRSWLGDDDDDEDPFAEIDEGFSEEDLEANLQRDKYARLCNQVNSLIDELTPSAPDFQLSDACDQLLTIMADTPEMQMQLVSSHGMLAILEVLEGRCSRDLTMKLLQIINVLVTADIGFLESFCLIGGIPVMMGFTSKKYPSDCRLEASHFIRLLCHTSVLTLQMFISCRGLKVLVDLLDEDYSEQTDLVVHALNGIGSVFELQSPTTKNDFCRMFIKEGLLDPLSSALLNVMANRGSSSKEMKMKIIQILLVFSQVSQSDIHVRNALGTRKVVRRLLRACELLEPECLVQMLKAVKHLSMNVTLLDVLQNANALEILIRILDEQSSSPHSTEMSNHIFQTCFNLCRLNKSRQEEAAQAGIIPCLKRVIGTKSPLKQFALPILCDLASAGKSCRTLLWQHDGLVIYLKLLEDPYFQVSALESIISWLQDETARVEDVLIRPESISSILNCFVTSKAVSFENLLDLFLKMTRISTPITIGLTKSSAFFKRIIDRLAQNTKAVVRLNLLRILKTVCEVHPNRAMLVEKYGLLGVVEGLSRGGGDGAVLVRELAREIVPVLRPGLKPASGGSGNHVSRLAGKNGIGSNVTPKRMRRTASETSAATIGTAANVSSSHLSSTARVGGSRPRARQRLGDIAWQGQAQGQADSGSGGRV